MTWLPSPAIRVRIVLIVLVVALLATILVTTWRALIPFFLSRSEVKTPAVIFYKHCNFVRLSEHDNACMRSFGMPYDIGDCLLRNPEKRYLNTTRQSLGSIRRYDLVINFHSGCFGHFFDVPGECRFKSIVVKYRGPHSPCQPVHLIDDLTDGFLGCKTKRVGKTGMFTFGGAIFAAGLHLKQEREQ